MVCQNVLVLVLDVGMQKDSTYLSDIYTGYFDTFTFAVLNITIKYKCIFEKKSCSELTLTLVLNDYRLNQTATLLIGEPSQLEL